MSTAPIPSARRRIWFGTRAFRIGVLAVLIGAAIVASAIVQGDVPEVVGSGTVWVRSFLHRYSYAGGFGLLYVEESGIPLPVPGDVFVMYVGAHVPRSMASWLVEATCGSHTAPTEQVAATSPLRDSMPTARTAARSGRSSQARISFFCCRTACGPAAS